MSIFFSFGAVLASILGYAILPYTSCPEGLPIDTCDVATQNNGWRILLACSALTTFAMVLVRSLWLKLPETPKFLLSQDRTKETIIVLQDIARINGETVRINSTDLPRSRNNLPQPIDDETPMLPVMDDMTNKMLDSVSSSSWALLFSTQWLRTTILVWGIWTFTSVAFTMFNVFLPKYLETLGFQGEEAPSYKDVYWDYMIYSLAGVPGSVVSFAYTNYPPVLQTLLFNIILFFSTAGFVYD